MKNLLPIGTLGLAGLVGAGLLSFSGSTVAANVGQDAFTKREEGVTELVLVDDDDDADSNDRSRSRFTGFSRSTRDHTRSNFTRMSRDRDKSRSDKTRDWTRDGGDRTRDWSKNWTNDRSRADTRGRR